jgi:hypothetical protein
MTALREGRAWTPDGSLMSRLAAAAPYDADLFRAFLEIFTCLALPQEVFQRPAIREKVERSDHQAMPVPGPGRQQLLDLLSA